MRIDDGRESESSGEVMRQMAKEMFARSKDRQPAAAATEGDERSSPTSQDETRVGSSSTKPNETRVVAVVVVILLLLLPSNLLQ